MNDTDLFNDPSLNSGAISGGKKVEVTSLAAEARFPDGQH
jgi:hypothetical protein